MLLIFEMVVFLGLIIPLPYTVKRKLFAFISESPVVAKLQYGLRVSVLCCASSILHFADSILDYVHFHPHPLR
jgi:Bap31/Bap29 transmembrane region